MVGERGNCCAALAALAQVVSGGRKGAGGNLGERTSSAWSRAGKGRWGRRAGGAGGDNLKDGKEAASHGRSRGAGRFSNIGLILGGVHLSFFRRGEERGRARGGGVVLYPLGAGGARRVSGGMVVRTVGAVRQGGRLAASD